ncbi:DUF3310 domain-containing protein [Labrys neptuniae]
MGTEKDPLKKGDKFVVISAHLNGFGKTGTVKSVGSSGLVSVIFDGTAVEDCFHRTHLERVDVPDPAPKLSALTVQVGGDHYSRMKIQPIEFVMANDIGFVEGNVIKYVSRWKNKNGVQDLKKARHALDVLIEHAEKEAAKA